MVIYGDSKVPKGSWGINGPARVETKQSWYFRDQEKEGSSRNCLFKHIQA